MDQNIVPTSQECAEILKGVLNNLVLPRGYNKNILPLQRLLMRDYEYELSLALQKKLKKVIKGRIFVNVFHDTLIVQIKNPHDYEWEYKMERFSNNMITGAFSTDEVAKEVIMAYKSDIVSNLFEEVLYLD